MKLDTQSTQRLTEWFYAYSDALYRYARFYLNNSVEAQDVVQEVFSRVAEHIQSFRSEAHIKTWIFRIARNYMIDTLRRKRSLAGMKHELNLQHESVKIDTSML